MGSEGGLFFVFLPSDLERGALTPAPRPPHPQPSPQLYEPFYADFGPLNLGKTYRFCARTAELLEVRRVEGKLEGLREEIV